MKWKIPLLIVAVLAVAVFASSRLSAQGQPTKIVFVNSAALLKSISEGQKVIDLGNQEASDLKDLNDKAAPLLSKLNSGQSLSDDERSQLNLLQQSYQSVKSRDDAAIQKALKPAEDKINAAIKTVAEKNHYTIILDGNVAGPNGTNLVVYADQGLDITSQVITQLGGKAQ
jgi:Skp family chaperone for outer membrane proteins